MQELRTATAALVLVQPARSPPTKRSKGNKRRSRPNRRRKSGTPRRGRQKKEASSSKRWLHSSSGYSGS